MTLRPGYCLSVVYRAKGLGVAVMRGSEIVEVLRHRLTKEQRLSSSILERIKKTSADYSVKTLIVELNSPVHLAVRRSRRWKIMLLDIPEAKRYFLPANTSQANRRLYQFLVDRHPKLKRMITILPRSGQVALCNDRRRIVPLLAVALGLAAQRHTGNLLS